MGWIALVALPVAAFVWARLRLRIVEVRGNSMMPTYADGDRLLIRRGPAVAGQPVVFRSPNTLGRDVDWLVKRAVATAGQPVPETLQAMAGDETVPAGRLLVRGDNPHSIDSRHFGYVTTADVLGTPLRRLPTREPARAVR